MAQIRIKRSSQFANRFRKINILIDDKKLADISNNQALTLDVPSGHHNISASIDFIKTEPLWFHSDESIMAEFELSSPLKFSFKSVALSFIEIIVVIYIVSLITFKSNTFLLLPIFMASFILLELLAVKFNFGFNILYYLTFGRKKYLTLKQIK